MIDIKNNAVFIIGQGTSAYELQDKITYFENNKIIWASLNRFSFIEEKILSKINNTHGLAKGCKKIGRISDS